MIADRPTIAASYGSDGSYGVIAIMSATLICLLYRLATPTPERQGTRARVRPCTRALGADPHLPRSRHWASCTWLRARSGTSSWVVTIARMALPYGFVLAIVLTTFFAATALKTIVAG